MSKREQRAQFLIKWFLDVFEGHQAPYPRKCFQGIALHMKDWLAEGDALDQDAEDQAEDNDILAEARELELALAQTGEAEYRGRTIRPAPGDGYTISGHDRYADVPEAIVAIREGPA